MAAPAIDALARLPGVACVTLETIDAFLEPDGRLALLFIQGDPKHMPEAHDVAVVLREIAREQGGRVKLAIIDREAEGHVRKRFAIAVAPSVVFLDGDQPLSSIPRIQDWGVYAARIAQHLAQIGAAGAGRTT